MKKMLVCALVHLFPLLLPLTFALESVTPESAGIPSGAILDFLNAVEKEVDALHGVVIVRNGKIISKGWWAPYRENTEHMLYSLSKSFTSTAIGMAIDEKILNLDDKVVSFFPDEVPANAGENLRRMRIRDLLCMGSGNQNDTMDALKGAGDKSWVAAFLAQPVEHEPGTYFRYNTGATYMLSAILQKATGKPVIEFLKPRLFDPLGITGYSWEVDPKGINTGGYGLKVKTGDIARFGQLYLQKGVWEGKRLVSEQWVDAATSKQIDNGSNPGSDWTQGYGFQFWRCRYDGYRGDGAFGQYCVVMPAQKTVIAINSGLGDMQKVLALIWQHLLPAMKDHSLPEDTEASAALQKKLETLKLPAVAGQAAPTASGEVYGKEYALDANEKDLKSVTLCKENGRQYVKFVNAHGVQTVEFDGDRWVDGRMMFEKEIKKALGTTQGEQKIAASGGWQAADHFRLIVYFVETPFRLQFDFRFAGDSVAMDLQQNVNFGPTKWPLKGKVAGGKDLIMAYYYPWYIKGDWTRHKHEGVPVLGEYGTDDPAVAAKHIELSVRAGIDALAISWWGKDSLTDQHLNKGFLQAENLGSIKFAFIYEAFGILDKEDGKVDSIVDFSQPGVMKRLTSDFICLRDEYFKNPSYLRISGKPVVVVYVTRQFFNFNAGYLRLLEKELGMELFLIADEAFNGNQSDPATARNGLTAEGAPIFSAYTAYNMFENKDVREGESALDYMRREAFPVYAKWGRKTVFCPHVMPTYHDFRGNRVLKGTPAEFRTMIDEVKTIPSMPAGDGITRIMMVTSFNEWWEGTTIEPAGDYGTSYLDVIRAVRGR